jgi:CRISPR-associated protein Cst2
MFKHIYVRHLTELLREAGEPLSAGATMGSPDRITVDSEFKDAIKGRKAPAIQSEMLARCAVTDIAGALFTEGITVPRKSCVEFGWLLGIPEKVHTEQYFHVKYETERRKVAPAARGEGTIAGAQTVFHRPASSGIYALVCNLELSRIGMNDITRESSISSASRTARMRASVRALLATLLRPAGAQTNTQAPHVVACSGILSTSASYLPAPMLSPLAENYREDVAQVAATLNRIAPESLKAETFDTMPEIVSSLEAIAAGLRDRE